jgi:hypothetical protein
MVTRCIYVWYMDLGKRDWFPCLVVVYAIIIIIEKVSIRKNRSWDSHCRNPAVAINLCWLVINLRSRQWSLLSVERQTWMASGWHITAMKVGFESWTLRFVAL